MKEEVVAIGAYCPDKKRQDVLETLLINLKLNYPQADLLVYSRSLLPSSIIKLADKVIIDNNNPILHDPEFKSILWWEGDDFIAHSSSYNHRGNTHLSSTYNFFNSWNYCKYLGYSKIYYIEYDVKIKNYSIFDEAKSLLKSYDAVIYSRTSTYLYPFFAFNGDTTIPPDYRCFTNSIKKEILYLKNNIKKGITSEIMGIQLFKNYYQDKVIFPNIGDKCEVLIDSTPLKFSPWNWVVVNLSNHEIYCISYNPNSFSLKPNVTFEINNKIICEIKSDAVLTPHQYFIHHTDYTLDQVENIKITSPTDNWSVSLTPKTHIKYKRHNYIKFKNYIPYENI